MTRFRATLIVEGDISIVEVIGAVAYAIAEEAPHMAARIERFDVELAPPGKDDG